MDYSWTVNTADEFSRCTRVFEGRQEADTLSDNTALHQVTATHGEVYTWGVNGDIETRTGGRYGDAVFALDWRDRLLQVEQGDPMTRLNATALHRTADKTLTWITTGDYSVTITDTVDLSEVASPAATSGLQLSFKHLATDKRGTVFSSCENISGSCFAKPPIPGRASLFYSADEEGQTSYVGAENSLGGGKGCAYSRPNYKRVLVELHFDRGTLEAFVSNSLFRHVREVKLPSAKWISIW